MDETFCAYMLSCVKGVGGQKIKKLLAAFGSGRAVFSASESALSAVEGISKKDAAAIAAQGSAECVRRAASDYEKMLKKGIKFTRMGDAKYPEKLKNIYNPPYSLFYKGSLPDPKKKTVAVVGARNASYMGAAVAEKMGRALAESGIQVAGGLARGVDVAAHRGALSIAGGRTFAVMGCGADVCYPRQNIEEYTRMQEAGGIISELPPSSPPLPGNFPMRNRIISGLSDAVLVVEAGKKSGSLITAEFALEQGRDVFVVPGAIDDERYEGSNELIKSGAALITGPRDVIDALGLFYDESVGFLKKKNAAALETSEKIVYASLGLEPAHISEISRKTGFDVRRTMEVLMELETKHYVIMAGGNYFALRI